MKAITTKYHGHTPTRPATVSATDLDGNKAVVNVSAYDSADLAHDGAAIALCRKMGWGEGPLMRGSIKIGNVYVFDQHANRLRFAMHDFVMAEAAR